MKHLLFTTIAAVVLVGCGPSVDIHQAAKTGNIKAVKQHLAAGADVNAKDDKFGLTPLHFAAGRDRKEIVELLIAKGVNVNEKDNRGGTPLHSTASGGRKEIAKLLIAKGADVNAKDEDGETPLDWAIRNSNWKHVRRRRTETADLIDKHGGKTRKELEAAELGVSVEGLPYISIHDAAGAAGRDGNIEAVKQHLVAGTDVDARDAEDKTPLQHAAYWGHKEIAELLIAKGADVNAKDNVGTTTLDWAKYKPEIADLLRKHGGKTGEELKAAGN